MAPEMIEQKGHSFTLDWWTLGIFLYEMLYGCVPFLTSDVSDEKLIKMIKNRKVNFPSLKWLDGQQQLSDECKDFISQCLIKDPKKRLGAVNDV